jgi:hypothetical protein
VCPGRTWATREAQGAAKVGRCRTPGSLARAERWRSRS